MTSLKNKISNWLKGRTFENSKDALWNFEKETGEKSSIIYFSRVFAEHSNEVRKTKKDKVADFIRKGGFANCNKAFDAYTATGENASLIYFSRVYTMVRKERATTATKIMKVTKLTKQEEIVLKDLTAKQIISTVKKSTGVIIKINVKNKQAIRKQASLILTEKGFLVK